MNKKNVSFVLAFVLSIGLGLGSMSLAYATNNEWGSSMATQTLPEYTVNASSSSTGIGDQASANQAVYKLSAVFNYLAGIMTSTMDSNRNITLMSMNQPKAMLVYDDGTNSWTPASLTVDGTDWAEISKTEVSEEVLAKFRAAYPNADVTAIKEMAQLYQFLLNAGVPEASLTVSSMTSGGHDQDIQQVSAWFGQAVEELKKGVSHSINLNFTAAGGSTCTVSEYGKPQATLSSDYTTDGSAVIVEAYIYDADGVNDGLLDAVYRLNYEAKDPDGNGNIALEAKYTVEIYNNYLQASTTISMNADSFASAMGGNLSIATIEAKAKAGEDGFKVTMTTKFNSDGSIARTTDADGNYTIYAGAVKITYNKEGTITGRSEDLGNGFTISESYGKDGTVTSRTYVRFGRVLYSESFSEKSPSSALLDDSNGGNSAALAAAVKASQIYNEYRSILIAGTSDVKDKLAEWRNANPNIKDVALYGSTLAQLNANSLRAIFNLANGATNQDYINFKNKLLAMDNGVSQVASLSFETITAVLSTTSVHGGAGNTTQAGRDGVGVITTVCDRGMSYMKFERQALREATNGLVTVHYDPAVDGTLAGPQLSDAELEKLFGLPEGSVKDGKYTDPKTGEEIAIFDEEKGYVNPKDKNQTFKDGYLTVVDEEGNVTKYAVVKDATVSVLNGEGENGTNSFDSATGELILVDVTEIAEKDLPKAGQRALFMGNVREDINGNMTMAVDITYSGGVAIDPEEIKQIETQIIAGLSSDVEWIKNNTAKNMKDIEERGATGQDWKIQWAAIMDAAGYTPPEKEQQILEQLKKMKEGQLQATF
ncbi:MAG: hypothetical protein PHR82_08550 [Endomicrobiaceae bacterium]|nr:hypothetical protein [Endomicrobiaceae bacterium]